MITSDEGLHAIAQWCDAEEVPSREDRALLAAAFVREILGASMVRLVFDGGHPSSEIDAQSADDRIGCDVWVKLTADDLVTVRALGRDRDIELPNGFWAACLREGERGGSVTASVVFGPQADRIASVRATRTVLHLVRSRWNLDDQLQLLRIENSRLVEALDSRIVVEQAKGVLAERLGIEPAEAFSQLRRTARDQGTRVVAIAQEIVRSRQRVQELR